MYNVSKPIIVQKYIFFGHFFGLADKILPEIP